MVEMGTPSARILIVDDERVIREILSDFLKMEGYAVECAPDGAVAIEMLNADVEPFDLVVTDLKMPNVGGIELIDHISKLNLPPVPLVMTGFGTVETAIAAMKKGAYDYILKPFKVEEVLVIIERALEKKRLREENIQLRETLSLYNMSQALNTSLSLDRVLEILLDTTMAEVDADAVCLLLRDGMTDTFTPAVQQTTYNTASEVKLDLMGVPDIKYLRDEFEHGRPVLAHRADIERYFTSLPSGKPPLAFMALPLKVRDRLIGMLNVYGYEPGMRFTEGQRKLLSVLSGRAATAIENARLYEELKTMFRETLESLILALEAKDRYTAGHTKRVTEYTRIIVEAMALSAPDRETICQGAMLHDIGKIGIDPQKINKPGKLTDEEMTMFRSHPAIGRRIVAPIKFLENIIPCVYYHHERFDGTGYPDGLQGPDIPLGARIVAVADTYDAMTSTRAYRKALSHDVAAAELRRCRGSQFDPKVVDVFLTAMAERRSPEAAQWAREAALRDEVAPEYYALQKVGAAPAQPAAEEIGRKGE